jgi:hypothetical protein
MHSSLREHWQNCAIQSDPEIRIIDRMEDAITPLHPSIREIRALISHFELCHHKAERWIENIIQAIGSGETDKGMGAGRKAGDHPAEMFWKGVCRELEDWCKGYSLARPDTPKDEASIVPALSGLGKQDALKVWQVRRVIEKIQSVIGGDETHPYVWLLLGGGEYESFYVEECPAPYRPRKDCWTKTARTIIHDTVDGVQATLSLALAIDMLWPCHWRFRQNLNIVLNAIGGDLIPVSPFAACGRNIGLIPFREKMHSITDMLALYGKPEGKGPDPDIPLFGILGEPTLEKLWLAASLEKTIRLQMNPPAEMHQYTLLDGPDWIRSA